MSAYSRNIREERKALRAHLKGRLEILREEAGVSGPLASKVANAEVRALASAFDFFEALNELSEAGKPDIAGELCGEFFATLLIDFPKEDRRQFMEIVLRIADEIDKKSEAAE